jgi:hypothetical protein
VSSYFDGLIACKYGRATADAYSVSLDISEIDRLELEAPFFLKLEEALDLGYITRNSPIGRAASKYDLSHVAVYGTSVVGPSPDTISAMEWFCEGTKLGSVLDVFAGTGALTKVALRLGATKVTMVDIGRKPPLNLTRPEWRKVTFISTDVGEIKLKGRHNVAILDPFCDDVLEFTVGFAKRISHSSRHILFHLGWKDRRALLKEAISNLERQFATLQILQVNDSMIYVGRSRYA